MDAWGISTLVIMSVCAVAFIALVVYLIVTLVSVNKVLNSIKHNMHVIDPFMHVVDRVGHTVDEETQFLDELARHFGIRGNGKYEGLLVDVVKWVAISATLFQKFRKKRR